jgi:hypothetical protein
MLKHCSGTDWQLLKDKCGILHIHEQGHGVAADRVEAIRWSGHASWNV